MVEEGFNGIPNFLLGTYRPKLDDKGRLLLPAKFRPHLSAGLVMTRGQDRCLFIFPMHEFSKMYQKIRSAPVTSKEARDYQRVLLSGASDETPDKQGRISIPGVLKEYAGLNREVVVIGAGTRIEVWDALAWDQYLDANETKYSDSTDNLIEGLDF